MCTKTFARSLTRSPNPTKRKINKRENKIVCTILFNLAVDFLMFRLDADFFFLSSSLSFLLFCRTVGFDSLLLSSHLCIRTLTHSHVRNQAHETHLRHINVNAYDKYLLWPHWIRIWRTFFRVQIFIHIRHAHSVTRTRAHHQIQDTWSRREMRFT